MIKVDKSEYGRGIFATKDIAAHTIVEISPVLIIPSHELPYLDKTILFDYYYVWENSSAALALGYGSLFNHSSDANLNKTLDFINNTISYTSIREIKKGEELFINYNGEANNKDKTWFELKENK